MTCCLYDENVYNHNFVLQHLRKKSYNKKLDHRGAKISFHAVNLNFPSYDTKKTVNELIIVFNYYNRVFRKFI